MHPGHYRSERIIYVYINSYTCGLKHSTEAYRTSGGLSPQAWPCTERVLGTVGAVLTPPNPREHLKVVSHP